MTSEPKKKPYAPPQVRSEKVLVPNMFGSGQLQEPGNEEAPKE
jgi:hypothetical protein